MLAFQSNQRRTGRSCLQEPFQTLSPGGDRPLKVAVITIRGYSCLVPVSLIMAATSVERSSVFRSRRALGSTFQRGSMPVPIRRHQSRRIRCCVYRRRPTCWHWRHRQRGYGAKSASQVVCAPGTQILLPIVAGNAPPGRATVLSPTYADHSRAAALCGHTVTEQILYPRVHVPTEWPSVIQQYVGRERLRTVSQVFALNHDVPRKIRFYAEESGTEAKLLVRHRSTPAMGQRLQSRRTARPIG